jgi:ribosomal protein S6--L-glutamate ligase
MTETDVSKRIIALEGRLRASPMVLTLGVRPNYSDYDDRERKLIRDAPKIYYPSSWYALLFHTMGKPIFPSYHNYLYAQDKIKQSALFQVAGINHPRTRVFYGKRQKQTIRDYFEFPLIAKVPRGSALGRGVYLIRSMDELVQYCQRQGPAYIQEYLPIDRDMRIVVVGGKVVHAYWRIAARGEFRNNLAFGGRIDLADVPSGALQLALQTARTCKWDDVGLDICEYEGDFYVLEGNMKYGRQGFEQAGIDYIRLLLSLVQNGEI